MSLSDSDQDTDFRCFELSIQTLVVVVSALLYNLFFGLDQSDCPLPCATFSTEVNFLSRVDLDTSGIEINFLPSVEVQYTYMCLSSVFNIEVCT